MCIPTSSITIDKIPTGYCHLPQSLFEFARQAKDRKQ